MIDLFRFRKSFFLSIALHFLVITMIYCTIVLTRLSPTVSVADTESNIEYLDLENLLIGEPAPETAQTAAKSGQLTQKEGRVGAPPRSHKKSSLKTIKLTSDNAMQESRLLPGVPPFDSLGIKSEKAIEAEFVAVMRGSIASKWRDAMKKNQIYGGPAEIALVTSPPVVRMRMDSFGRITEYSIEKSSGLKEVDSMMAEVFSRVGGFPNPPPSFLQGSDAVDIEWVFYYNGPESINS